jgi:hypothetical protein
VQIESVRLRLACHERVAVHTERSGVALAVGTFESVDRATDGDLDKTGCLDQCRPACTRQATGNSTGPEVDLAPGFFRYGFGVGDVGKLEDTARAEHAEGFGESPLLVRAQIDHTVRDDHVGPRVLDG